MPMSARNSKPNTQEATVRNQPAAGLSGAAVSQLAKRAKLIFQDNYRSVLAAQRMKDSIERLDSASLFIPVGKRDLALQPIKDNRQRFEAELKVQESNITEPGEQEATEQLRSLWTEYARMSDRYVMLADGEEIKEYYFSELQPQFMKVKDAADAILSINQDAMVRKSDEAGTLARTIDTVMVAAAVLASLLGLMLSSSLTNRLLSNPLVPY